MHNDLLAIARGLAENEGVGRSRTAQRRAVSSAYYAAFHALAGLCADALVGASQPWDVVSPIYRSLDHASIRRVFEASRQRRALGDGAVRAGETILVLQQVRHTADYDPNHSRSDGESVSISSSKPDWPSKRCSS